MPDLYVLHKLPTPYNDDLFRAIHQDGRLDLHVFHLRESSDRRPWSSELATGYPNYFMRPRAGVDWHCLRAALGHRNSLFMVGDWGHVASNLLTLARLLRRAPVVLWVDTPQEHLHRPLFKRIPRRLFLRWLLRSVDGVLASGIPARRALLSMGAKPDGIIDFQFSVDIDRPDRRRCDPVVREGAREHRSSVGCLDGGVVLAMCGTLDIGKKGQDLGLEIFRQARESTGHPLGLLIAGTGPDEPRLKADVARMGISDAVRFLGWQEPDEMDSVYLAADLLLHPAHYDPFPLVVLEAMSWSCAVVGTASSGSVEERVRVGQNGYDFPPGDLAAGVKAVLAAVQSTTHLHDLQSSARTTAESWPLQRSVDILVDTTKGVVSHS